MPKAIHHSDVSTRLPVSTRTLRGCLICIGEGQLNKELITPLRILGLLLCQGLLQLLQLVVVLVLLVLVLVLLLLLLQLLLLYKELKRRNSPHHPCYPRIPTPPFQLQDPRHKYGCRLNP
jgi:hypothetical protein